MELIEGLLSRRSVRQYTDKPVESKEINAILKAGMYAPSARNQQIWRFIVITDRTKLESISLEHKYASMAKDAAFAIAVCADIAKGTAPEFWDQDCSAAVENMMLAAHAKGIGTVWIGMHPHPERQDILRRLCKIPENIQIHSLVVGGYPAAKAPEPERFHTEYICENTWKI